MRRIPGTPTRRGRAATPADKRKLFVLDTNVLIHDPMSIFSFAEHDVFLPMTVLEELDNHKKGTSDVARNARSVSRSLDQLMGAQRTRSDTGRAALASGQQGSDGQALL